MDNVMTNRKKSMWRNFISSISNFQTSFKRTPPAGPEPEPDHLAIHETRTKLATDLLAANMEMDFQNEEKKKHDAELDLARKEMTVLDEERVKKEAESLVANQESVFQHEEKVKLSTDLLVAQMSCAFQEEEKEKRAAELIIANAELIFQNEEKEKRANELLVANAELSIANEELIFQNAEKEKRAAELVLLNGELTRAEDQQAEYIRGLEQMMFLTSHRVRQPVANILGIAQILDSSGISQKEFNQAVQYMKESAVKLDAFTKELTAFIEQLGKKTGA
jgi:hypothetical protein